MFAPEIAQEIFGEAGSVPFRVNAISGSFPFGSTGHAIASWNVFCLHCHLSLLVHNGTGFIGFSFIVNAMLYYFLFVLVSYLCFHIAAVQIFFKTVYAALPDLGYEYIARLYIFAEHQSKIHLGFA